MTQGRSALGSPCGAAIIASWMDLNWPSPFGATVASAAREVTESMTAARQPKQECMIDRIMMILLTNRIEAAGTADSRGCDGLLRISALIRRIRENPWF